MFGRSLPLPFRLLGIPVRLDVSFLLILPLFAWLISQQIPTYAALLGTFGVTLDTDGLQRGFTPYMIGFIAALGLFGSVLLHELGHAVTARGFGVRTTAITLWFLGGAAQLDDMPQRKGAEAVISLAGPVTNLLLAALFALPFLVSRSGSAGLFLTSYLVVTNAALAVFNLLPALPLDGGRVLRSLLGLFMPHLRATQVTAFLSQLIAIALAVSGFLGPNLLLLAVAFFIYSGVRAETQHALLAAAFRDLRVRDIMTREPITVDPGMRLDQFLRLTHYRKHVGYPVVDQEDRMLGFATLADARQEVAEDTVASIIRDAETVSPDAEAFEALKRITRSELGRLLVTDNAKLVGLVSKTDLLLTLQAHQDGTPLRPLPDSSESGRSV